MEIRFYHYEQFRQLQMSSKTSLGNRITKDECDARIREAKQIKLDTFYSEHGYYFCEECLTSQGRIDCSHTIGVGKAKQDGRTELCWDVENIRLLCRSCHQKHDRL